MRRNGSLLVTAGAVLALSLGGVANAGIENTKHNMSSSGSANQIYSSGVSSTDEICVFCHTPHMNVAKGDVIPLWNHRLSSGALSYTMYKSATFNGGDNTGGVASLDFAAAPDQLDGSMSVTNLCLSCHDGTQAVNAMLNTPNRLDTNPTMFGGVEKIPNTSKAFLDTDLQNDHPVNFSYKGSEDVSTETLHASALDGSGVTAGGNTVRLFNGTVQCASCHDPHKDYSVATGDPDFTPFLRVKIAGSTLCLTCHNK